MELFEVHETTNNVMALEFQMLLEKFGLICCVVIFVKGEGRNLGSMPMTLQSIIDYEPL
jgi:hypothetical protein